MQPFQSLVHDVETAIASGEGSKRADTLRQLTTLFIQQSPHLAEDHVNVFDEVLSRIANKIEFRARVELAERLADVGNAPLRTVRDLALDDDIEIARPILVRSTRLREDDLVEVATRHGQSHLLAISNRPDLTAAVTDVLVSRGDGTVVRTVAGNAKARFSERGFDTMLKRALEDSSLQNILSEREDLPETSMQTLVNLAVERVRSGMSAEGRVSDDMLADALAAGADDAMRDSSTFVLDADIVAALPTIFAKAATGLKEEDIVGFVKQNQLPEALAGIAYLASMPADTISQAWSAPQYDPLLFLARGLRFNWPTFKLLLEAKSGRAVPASLLREAFQNFQDLSVPTAQRAMRFVVARGRIGPQ